ncbi:hypothetical protein EVAR_94630_1 [Eumeta japonica]|uniref:Uncharacterized protein n=1 Tax=Eumeta variegata TaxID=151549 RepID=A0A4C1UU90_EUMVA|nr:hypothetical protein EVAR_94630_1 [Eumeta japonica]
MVELCCWSMWLRDGNESAGLVRNDTLSEYAIQQLPMFIPSSEWEFRWSSPPPSDILSFTKSWQRTSDPLESQVLMDGGDSPTPR